MRDYMEKSLCSIEILKRSDSYIAKIQTDLGGVRKLNSPTFEGILEQVVLDIQEEFEVAL
jgi:Mg2+/Co2+ transporter CorC